MVDKDNSVNIEESPAKAQVIKGSYHHGDLRDALVRAGVAALDSGTSVDELSLRALARSVGVSATAVYRHFPDKAALLSALAGAGLDRLGELQMTASRAHPANPVAAFAATGSTYVRFALAHPALFRLIWATAPDGDLLEVAAADKHPAMACLQEGIAKLLPTGTDAAARRVAALTCWSLVHGLAMLALDRQIDVDDATIDRVVGGVSIALERDAP